jgi:hypothetical protein
LVFLGDVLKQNSYNGRQIHRALNRPPHLDQPDNESNSVAFLLSVGVIFSRISKVLTRHNIKSGGLPHMNLSSLLRPIEDHLGLRTPGVYRIPCECDKVYIGQTDRSVDIRIKEHQRHIRQEYPDNSAVAEQHQPRTLYFIPCCLHPQIHGPH